MDNLFAASEPPNPSTRVGVYRLARKIVKATPSRRQKTFAVKGAKNTRVRLAQPSGSFQHRVKYRRKIAARGIDDLQHLGGSDFASKGCVEHGGALRKLPLQI